MSVRSPNGRGDAPLNIEIMNFDFTPHRPAYRALCDEERAPVNRRGYRPTPLPHRQLVAAGSGIARVKDVLT